METEIEERIAYYASLYAKLRKEFGAADVAIAVLEQVGKDTRMAKLRTWEQSNGANGTNGDVPATTKQLDFMRMLGLDVPDGLTKKEASALIDEELGNSAA